MRIGFITQWFPPEPGTHVAAGIATGLAERGHQVDVVTGFPNYPSGRLMEGWAQRFYLREEYSPGVTLHRSPLYPSHDSSPTHRMANYLSFAASATATANLRVPRPDVWLVYSSPATAAVPALLARRGRRAPICLHIQDLWPDSVTGSDFVHGRALRMMDRALHAFTNASYRAAERIGVISPSMKDILVQRGVPADKIRWVPNWSDNAKAPDNAAERRSLGLPSGPLFLYAGNLGKLQGLLPLVNAFADVPEAQLVLMGDGVEKDELSAAAADAPAGNVHVRNSVPADVVPHHLAAADVLVVSLKDSPLLRATMPSKVQSSMAAGKPILVHGAGDVADVVTDAGAGVAVRPGNHGEVADGIRELANQPDEWADAGVAARQHYEDHFAPDVGITRLESMLLEAAKRGQQ
ncbi:glycosyltransferase family 4 protein [Knoellia sp. CPCC 206453]|uniref:glycosyltransferase family 4 protein n=1 Tax=Knoellia pratensis TaxID=3404796 RepID=UPI003620BC96